MLFPFCGRYILAAMESGDNDAFLWGYVYGRLTGYGHEFDVAHEMGGHCEYE